MIQSEPKLPQAARLSRQTADWLISRALWRMYEHGKQGRPVSAQCEVQYASNLINEIVTR